MEVQLRLLQRRQEQLRMDQLPKEQVDQKPQRQVIRTNVLGLLGLAFSSLGAGVGGLHGREKENKDKKIEKIFNNSRKRLK